jgi:hypothetical protein
MKKLTREEFDDRMNAIQRARGIFIASGLTKNLTIAFELYQEIFADRERQLTLNSSIETGEHRNIMDNYERIKCPDCQEDMRFRVLPKNDEGIHTQLVCSKCDLVLDSEKTLQDWMNTLKEVK